MSTTKITVNMPVQEYQHLYRRSQTDGIPISHVVRQSLAKTEPAVVADFILDLPAWPFRGAGVAK